LSSSEREHPDPKAYFDDLYAGNSDPWRLATRWYEERKRAITAASLPQRRYGSGLEIGCSVGELTAVLAERCDALLGVDISDAAVQTATRRTSGYPGVRIAELDATVDFPDGPFDLVVLSEIAYYWDSTTLRTLLAEVKRELDADANVVACHWRHPVEGYALGGDEAHDIIRTELGMHSLVVHREDDFLLEVFSTSPDSVARREGFFS
jgi:SAM-dependent methyltransferase